MQREADEFFSSNSLFSAEITDENLLKAYEEQIKRDVAESRNYKSFNETATAKLAYQKISEGNSHKFAGNGKEYALYNNGQAVLTLLIDEEFMPETVRDVMAAHIPDRDQLEKVMEQCGQVKIAYRNIAHAPSADDADNMQDTYRAFAKNYMERHSLRRLNFEDDCRIVKEMKDADGYPDEFLKEALLAASPVVMEPGRDPEKTAESILSGELSLSQTVDKKANMENIVSPSDIYRNFISDSYRELQVQGLVSTERDDVKYGIPDAWRPYYDTLAARKIFTRHFGDADVIKTVAADGVAKDGDTYGRTTADKAKNILKAEQNLCAEAPEIPKDKNYAELMAMGIEPLDIYRSILKEKIDLNPSLTGRLYERGLDVDMAEACLTRYPDFDREALTSIIAASPRAVLVHGLKIDEGKQYDFKVMKEAEQRRSEYQEEQQATEQLKYEFNRQRGLAYQGIEAQNADPAYQYGRSAVMLLLKGFEPMDIRSEILQGLTPEIPIKDTPAKFADTIMEKATKVYERLMKVKNWDKETPETVDEEYLTRLHAKYLTQNTVRPSMDIEILRDMLLQEKYPTNDILQAIANNSPTAIEPGRDATYVKEYLLPKARNATVTAKDNLREDTPQPRENPLSDIKEEYAYQRQFFQERHPAMPYNLQMDILSAATLLKEGFAPIDVIQVLDAESPCRDNQDNYGQSIANKANIAFIMEKSEEYYHSESNTETKAVSIVRTRAHNPSTGNIEVTTETDTTTTTY